MVELLGRLPEELVREGQLARDYYNRAGELHHHPGLGFTTSLAARLLEFHRWGLEAAASFAGFLLPMLATKPGVRATAGQARAHAFLGDGVVVEDVGVVEEVEEVAKKAEEAKEEAVEKAVEGVDVNELVKRKVPRLSMTCYPQGIKNQSKAEVIKDIKGLNRSAHVKSMNKGRARKTISCGDCGKMFAGRAGLRYHKKKEHGVVSVQAWNLVGDEVLERRGGVREKVQVEVKAEVEDTFCNLDPLSP